MCQLCWIAQTHMIHFSVVMANETIGTSLDFLIFKFLTKLKN